MHRSKIFLKRLSRRCRLNILKAPSRKSFFLPGIAKKKLYPEKLTSRSLLLSDKRIQTKFLELQQMRYFAQIGFLSSVSGFSQFYEKKKFLKISFLANKSSIQKLLFCYHRLARRAEKSALPAVAWRFSELRFANERKPLVGETAWLR